MDKYCKLLLMLPLLTLLSCSSSQTWVVKRWQNGGIIGYKGRQHNMYAEIKKKVHCENFRIITNAYKSKRSKLDHYIDKKIKPSNETGYYIKEDRQTDSVSHQYTDQFWEEFTYKCYYHPYYDYSTGEDLKYPDMEYYDSGEMSSNLPYCHDYYGNNCVPANY
ncbi:MAG: hypothetical protein A2381_19815 [Bdellovibrionales bacterium RIFOXYB1_FULL_37_110]|nr:MAG: hypothetical protein A2181_03450 [Bdellovibrionales bacterium RIFOXYA1_FULL_38_20]OFZ50986.1 MAG: hypothetical protein A2417_19600 [Bdellovibrionales bacterium RIFOXYC1_FULL_37_79]OFZ60198.1 MAG: hypothetical protein A2381_19815 [Bdellovibrionales bacterium RIFOXYB1_FULL_37_110]